ncbi:MAG TPA: hypothetical protein VM870_02600 [Pyrinomonadaceae bacterium]|jgi:hypothetical protein|nr:hypothetical protein [Pyrinomonadaceae bacterium]
MSFTGAQIGDDQLMTRYLLGSLGPEEAERCDELSVADDDFAARLGVVESELIDAYVNGELSGQEFEQFRAQYLSSPIRREKVVFAQVLRQRAKLARPAAGIAEAEPERKTARPAANWFSRFFPENKFILPWAAAAALLLAVIAGAWFWRENWRLRRELEAAQVERGEAERRERELSAKIADRPLTNPPQEDLLTNKTTSGADEGTSPAEVPSAPSSPRPVIATFTLSPQVRGAGRMTTLEVPRGASFVILRIELEPNDYSRYRTILKTWPGEKIVWQSGELRARVAGGQRSISARLPAPRLGRQRYVLEVAGLTANGAAAETVGTYPFVVTNKNPAK